MGKNEPIYWIRTEDTTEWHIALISWPNLTDTICGKTLYKPHVIQKDHPTENRCEACLKVAEANGNLNTTT